MANKKAIVLFSGGLDSTTVLARALSENYDVTALTIDYKQRHMYELEASRKILVKNPDVKHIIFKIDLAKIGGSALTDEKINVPSTESTGIPPTYVPARNIIFLSIACSYAEKLDINNIFIGVNSIDYSGYPDCRPEFIESFQKMVNLGTKYGVEQKGIKIHTPLIKMSKSEIIKYGTALNVDYSMTVSCYSLNSIGQACGVCDACRFRKKGFLEANIDDPTIYKKNKKI